LTNITINEQKVDEYLEMTAEEFEAARTDEPEWAHAERFRNGKKLSA
jgi:hypothetical protein